MPPKRLEASENAAITKPIEPLSEKMSSLNQGLMSLYHASAELQFSKPLSSLLKTILRGLKTGAGIHKAAIFLKEESFNTLRGTASVGLNEKKITEITTSISEEEEAELLKLNLFSKNGSHQNPVLKRLSSLMDVGFDPSSSGIIPLENRNRLVGMLIYDKIDSIMQKEILIIFSRQAALTIENSRLFAKVEEMALRDTLTGIYNRRYFLQILDYELNRAKRYNQPLSIIFIDIDHFKEVNDNFGHSVGDIFLKQISVKLQTLFRTTDLVARYAGDEFVAILPSTTREGSLILANRIQQILSQFQVMVRGRTLQVSVSIGVDTFENSEGIGSATLIDRADKAMYEAKSCGRNCVKSYHELHKVSA